MIDDKFDIQELRSYWKTGIQQKHGCGDEQTDEPAKRDNPLFILKSYSLKTNAEAVSTVVRNFAKKSLKIALELDVNPYLCPPKFLESHG